MKVHAVTVYTSGPGGPQKARVQESNEYYLEFGSQRLKVPEEYVVTHYGQFGNNNYVDDVKLLRNEEDGFKLIGSNAHCEYGANSAFVILQLTHNTELAEVPTGSVLACEKNEAGPIYALALYPGEKFRVKTFVNREQMPSHQRAPEAKRRWWQAFSGKIEVKPADAIEELVAPAEAQMVVFKDCTILWDLEENLTSYDTDRFVEDSWTVSRLTPPVTAISQQTYAQEAVNNRAAMIAASSLLSIKYAIDNLMSDFSTEYQMAAIHAIENAQRSCATASWGSQQVKALGNTIQCLNELFREAEKNSTLDFSGEHFAQSASSALQKISDELEEARMATGFAFAAIESKIMAEIANHKEEGTKNVGFV